MNKNIDDRLKSVFSVVFEMPIEEINNESSPGSIELWDSLKHMNLVIALEEEFNIQFDDEEILEIQSFSLIKSTLLKYMKND